MGKYNYKVSFKGAIKAGLSKEVYSQFSSGLIIQTWIANELAEANRLKRWELLNNNWFEEDGRNRPIRSNKELEDKA